MKMQYFTAVAVIALVTACTSTVPEDDLVVHIDTSQPDNGQIEDGAEPDSRPDLAEPDATTDIGDPDEGNPDQGGHDIGPVDNGNPGDDNPGDQGGQDTNPADQGQETSEPRGRISVAPYLIDFGFVPLAGESFVPFKVTNVGDGPLRLDRFTTVGPAAIVLDVGAEGQVSGGKTIYEISPPKVLKVGATFDGKVVFKPDQAVEVYTEIRAFSSDTDYPDGLLFHAMGNKTRPALEVTPESIDFGAAVIGTPVTRKVTLKSVGRMDVNVYGVSPDAAALAAGFRVEFPDRQPTVQNPVTLAQTKTMEVNIVYDPSRASPVNAIGRPQPESGQIEISGDMFTGKIFQRVTGVAVEGACTMPIVDFINEYRMDGDGCPVQPDYPADDKNTRICKTEMGWEVPTGTLVQLSGAQSFSPFGDVTQWQWSATQPAANTGFFIPTENEVEPTFMIGAAPDLGAGENPYYEIFLNVIDNKGYEACAGKSIRITTRVEVKADILLSWKPVNPFTPVPPFMGQDVDLHFTHFKAGDDGSEPDIDKDGLPDDWFDLPYDCFWFNAEPEKYLWGEASPWINDRVVLRNDSDDGTEPEVLMMGLDCPAGRPFKVGAHYFDDHGYGQADVTIQVYAKGQLLYTSTRRLSSHDMWYVGDLKCKTVGLDKTAEFIVNTTKPVTPNYVNTSFGNP